MNEILAFRRVRAQAERMRVQMEVVIAEVTESVEERAGQKMRQARRTARLLQEMAAASGALIESFRVPQDVGSEITIIYRPAECLAAFAEPSRGASPFDAVELDLAMLWNR